MVQKTKIFRPSLFYQPFLRTGSAPVLVKDYTGCMLLNIHPKQNLLHLWLTGTLNFFCMSLLPKRWHLVLRFINFYLAYPFVQSFITSCSSFVTVFSLKEIKQKFFFVCFSVRSFRFITIRQESTTQNG